MKGNTKYPKLNIKLMMAINFVEFMIVITHGKNSFDHAFIDNLGLLFLGSLMFGFLVVLIKVAISDILRGIRHIKGNIA